MGQYNDDLFQTLREKMGREGALNDMLFASYRNMGYEGALNDMAYAARVSSGDLSLYPLQRYVRTFNGIDTSGAYAVPVAMGIGDTLKIQFAYPAGGVARNLNEYIQFDAGNLLQLTSCTATIDGTPVASGASMAAYIDGKLHEIEITATAAISVGYIGQNGAAGAFYAGQILANTFTISGVPTYYIIDNDSTTTTYARGNAAPSTKYITWSTFTAAYIEQYTYNAPSRRWEGVDRIVDGGFDTACGVNWACDAGWSIAASVADCNTSAVVAIRQNSASAGLVAGQRVLGTFTVISYTVGPVGLNYGGTGAVDIIASDTGIFSGVTTMAASAPSFDMRPGTAAGFIGSIDSVSIRHVLEYV